MTPRRRQRGYLLISVVVALFLLATVAAFLTHGSAISANSASAELEGSRADYVAQAGMQHALWRVENNACMGDLTIDAASLGPDLYSVTVLGAAAGTEYVLEVAEDAWIRSDDPGRNNDSVRNHIRFEAGTTEQALTRFDLSGLSPDAQINSATAWFYIESGKEHPEGAITVHEIAVDWDEASVSWDSFGGAYRTGAIATIPAQDTGDAWVAINLTGQVQAWVNGQSNHGILFRSEAEGVHAEYTGSEDGANPPRLEVVVGSGPASPVTVQSKALLANGNGRTLARPNTVTLQPPATIVLQPDEAGSADAYIWDWWQTTNFGNDDEAWVCYDGSSGDCVSLFRFDVDRVPKGARILDATMSLHHKSGSGTVVPVSAHRIIRSWDEDFVTWRRRDSGADWSDRGGDYGNSAFSTTDVGPASDRRYEWDITQLVQGWSDGRYPNYGVALTTTLSSAAAETFHTSADAESTRRPRLTISYACECGTPCVALQGAGRIALIGDDGSPDPDDQMKIELFESWGYDVDFFEDEDSRFISWNNYDLAYVSETVITRDLSANLADLSIGVVNEERRLYDDLRLASGSNERIGSSIDLVDTSHYITSVFQKGPLSIYTGGMEIVTADTPLATDLQILATFGGEATLTAIEEGGKTTSGTAAGRRVNLPFGQHFAADFDWSNLNRNGLLLVQRAIAWAIYTEPTIGDVLMVVGNDGNLTSQEEAKKALLESWGYTVNVIDEDDNQSAFDAASADSDVVFIGEDVTASDINTKLTNATIGVVTEEANLVDDLGMGDGIGWESGTKISVVNNGHYITYPFAVGSLAILDSTESLAYQIPDPAPGLKLLGSSDSGSGLTALEAGAELVTGDPAPGRRVLLPWGGDRMDIDSLNDNGRTIFQRAIEWASGADLPGPVAHWKLDEASGAMAADSAGSNDGTLVNGAQWAPGLLDGGLRFDGSDDRVDVGSFDVTGSGITMSGWFYADVIDTNDPRIISKANSTAVQGAWWQLSTSNAGSERYLRMRIKAGGTTTTLGDATTNLSPGNWYFAAGTYDADTGAMRLYLDGIEVARMVHAAGGPIDTDPSVNVEIGANGTAERFFDGVLDDVRVYDRALNDAEIAELAVRPPIMPIAHWMLDEASGSTAEDSVGDNDGSLIGNAAWSAGIIDGGLAVDYSDGDDYVDIPNSSGLENVQEGDYTLAAWFRPGSTPPGEEEENDANYGILIKAGWHTGLSYTNSNSFVLQQVFDGNSATGITSASFGPGSFHHVAGVVDRAGGRMSLYVNGQLQGTANFVPGRAAREYGTEPWRIGIAYPGTGTYRWPADGVIDDVRIYDRALSDSDILELAAAAPSLPIAHWTLDEGGGPTATDLVGGRIGALTNGPAWAAGVLDSAVRFDGSNDRINVPHDNGLNLVSEMTLSAWVNADSLKPFQMILTKGDNGAPENYWIAMEGNRLNFGFIDGGVYAQYTSSTLSLQAGTWHHVAATFDDAANEVVLYVDGTSQSFASNNTPAGNNERLIIGSSYYGGEAFDGVLDDVRIYNRALGSGDIAALAAAGSGGGGGGGPGGGCSGTFRDEFSARSYSNNDGTLTWATDWQETGESTSATGGDIRINDDFNNYQLQVRDDGQTIMREADLSDAGSATLSFEYRRQNLSGSNDYVAVDVSYNGGGNWDELARFRGTATDSNYLPFSIPLDSNSLSANTRIRFRTPGSGMSNDNMVWFDDVQIACTP